MEEISRKRKIRGGYRGYVSQIIAKIGDEQILELISENDDRDGSRCMAAFPPRSSTRCKCQKCNDSVLNGAREYRCCSEVNAAVDKLATDGSIERIKCITGHKDYKKLTETVVLSHLGTLLKALMAESPSNGPVIQKTSK
eukprot:gene7968-13867_t